MNKTPHKKWVDLLKQEKGKSTQVAKKEPNPPAQSYSFIFDTLNNKLQFITMDFTRITGFSAQEMTTELYLQNVHPEDLDAFFEKELQVQAFTNSLRYHKLFKYKFEYTYRMRKADGTYFLLLQEYQALEVNKEGYWAKSIVRHTLLNADCGSYDQAHFKIYDKEQGIYLDLDNKIKLTKREYEIIQLIKEGLTSKEISNALNLSTNTIQTHRKNILNKTNTHSFIELIKKLNVFQ
ncbi:MULTISPECIES: LuxR C-terminal-related transcriptional regulator [unclassified Myroides]|uniref:LuxR C-terminal-related transcriptional regulator n=1 Tax=unclassified Myroides TaxID=2642485 RepID=UPI003D2F867B